MYQIKFLKPLSLRTLSLPETSQKKVKKSKPTHFELSTTLTISNDLGETNFYGDATLEIKTKHTLRESHLAKSILLNKEVLQWEAGKRAINFSVVIPFKQLKALAGFISIEVDIDRTSKVIDKLDMENFEIDELLEQTLPKQILDGFKSSGLVKQTISNLKIFPIASDFIPVPKSFDDIDVLKTDRISIRKVGDSHIQLYEELSGSIARHLWDAGLLIVDEIEIVDLLSFINEKANKVFKISDNLDILELGTGIGLVSIHLKKKLMNSNVLSTDLIDAKEIYDKNLVLNGLDGEASIRFEELDWEKSEKTSRDHDLIVITDCTYNPLYYDPLITVLKKNTSNNTVVVIAHKFREGISESGFFQLMITAGFTLKGCKVVSQNGQYLIFMGVFVKS